MSDNFPAGRIPMVKIDGAKIRQLRESKGLTQLFLAASVEVTTDTISRWENRRYPTIKKENAIRLAETLEVDLDAILDHSDTETEYDDSEITAEGPEGPHPAPSFNNSPTLRRYAFAAAVILLLLTGVAAWLMLKPASREITVRARRILPSHTVAGQPFPVAIAVSTESASPQTLILKESLPAGAVLLSAIPETSAVDSQNLEMKWLYKITGQQIFVYVARLERLSGANAYFSGTVAIRQAPGEQIAVTGRDRIELNSYHWADGNSDGHISDEEILTIYDTFSEIDGLELDIEQVEEMWMGSGYRWDESDEKFVVLP